MNDEVEDKMKKNKKGVRRGGVRVVPRPFNPQLKFASKAQALEIRARENKANKAADLARRTSLAEQEVSTPQEVEDEVSDVTVPAVEVPKETSVQEKVQSIKKEIKDVRKALEKEPKSTKLKKKLVKLEADLDSAEDELEDLEETKNSNQE